MLHRDRFDGIRDPVLAADVNDRVSGKTAWRTAKATAGITCRFHDLRHTFCTRLLERGAPFAALATIMGWSPATAMRMVKRYGHIGKSIQRDAVELLDPASEPQAETPTPAPTASGTNATLVPAHPTVQ